MGSLGGGGGREPSSPPAPPFPLGEGEEGSTAPLLPLPSPLGGGGGELSSAPPPPFSPLGEGEEGAQLRSSPSLLPPGDDVWQKSLPKVGWQNRRRRLFDKINVARQSDSKVAELYSQPTSHPLQPGYRSNLILSTNVDYATLMLV